MSLRMAAVRLIIALIRLYKMGISPLLSPSCRFTPSCSVYAMNAFEKHGLVRGFYLSAMRLLRCNPFCRGGYDPVP